MDIELPHSSYKSLDAVKHIFVDSEAVEAEFLVGIAVLMDDFHLLYNC